MEKRSIHSKKKFNNRSAVHLNLPTGVSSVMLIFLTVSLVSFAILSLQTAIADKKLTDKTSEYTESYYAAVHQAQAFLADNDAALSQIYKKHTGNPDKYAEEAGKLTTVKDFPISDLQNLHVELETVYPSVTASSKHRKDNLASRRGAFYRPSCFYNVISFCVMTSDSSLEYEEPKVPTNQTGGQSTFYQ